MSNYPAGVTDNDFNWKEAPEEMKYCECGTQTDCFCINCSEPICDEHSYSWNVGEYWCVDCYRDK